MHTGLQQSQATKTSRKDWSKEDLPSVEEDQVTEHLNELEIPKSTGPDRLRTWVLRELQEPLQDHSQLKHSADWERFLKMDNSKHHSYLQEVQEGRSGELLAGEPHLGPWKGVRERCWRKSSWKSSPNA